MKRVGWAVLALTVPAVGGARTSEGVPVADDGVDAESRVHVRRRRRRCHRLRKPTCPNPASCRPAHTGTGGHRDLLGQPATAGRCDGVGAGPGGTEDHCRSARQAGRRRRATVTSAPESTGPDGIWATVTIARTPLDPAAAFKKYADEAMAASAVSSVSVLPADLCGYSGQKLLGAWSDTPQQAVEFGDRIAHVWTNTEQLPGGGARGGARRTLRDSTRSPRR